MGVDEPAASRPHMPGYGIAAAGEGRGLLPWSWAEERLIGSHDYWVATVRPDGRPHVMPVWGVWLDAMLWFSSSPESRKTRNLRDEPRCTVTTDNALEPVVLEGVAGLVTDRAALPPFVEATNAKYDADLTLDFFAANATFRVQPHWIFSLTEDDFTGSPTRWRFETLT